jgi:1-acyl-sn-glycerol-3-phosphate acyltransferase
MAYRRGDPFANTTLGFRILSHFTYLSVVWPLLFVSRVIFGLRVKNGYNLRHARSAFLVSNHTLFLDPGVLSMAVLPFRTLFTMLEETALIPVLGTFVRLLGAVPIPEDSRQFRRFERNLQQALRLQGFVHFFPEGECYHWSQEVQPFHPGVFVLASRLEVPVIPIATVLHRRSWGGRHYLGFLRRRIYIPPRVTVVIGSPLEPASSRSRPPSSLRETAAALQKRTQAWIQGVIDRQGGSKTIYRGQMPRIAGDSARR